MLHNLGWTDTTLAQLSHNLWAVLFAGRRALHGCQRLLHPPLMQHSQTPQQAVLTSSSCMHQRSSQQQPLHQHTPVVQQQQRTQALHGSRTAA